MDSRQQRSACPISNTLDLLGDKWSLLIMRDTLLLGKRRYGDFLASPEGISTNILADRLKRLEISGILEKFPDPSDGKASLYIPTEQGVKLLPVLIEIIRWGLAEFRESVVPEFVLQLLDEGITQFMDEKFLLLDDERKALAYL